MTLRRINGPIETRSSEAHARSDMQSRPPNPSPRTEWFRDGMSSTPKPEPTPPSASGGINHEAFSRLLAGGAPGATVRSRAVPTESPEDRSYLSRLRQQVLGRLREVFSPSTSVVKPQEPANFWFPAFAAQPKEITIERIPNHMIEGKIPQELRGTFYRNGPGQYEVNGHASEHLFDGDGMIAAWEFSDQGISFRNRFIRTETFVEEKQVGRRVAPGFGTLVPKDPLANMGGNFKNYANTSVVQFNGKLLALYEGGRPYALDPKTLKTIGEHDFKGTLPKGALFSAHPRIDETGLYNFGVEYGPTSKLHFYHVGADGKANKVHEVRLRAPISPHDVGVTENYFVMPAMPYVVNFKKFLKVIMGRATLASALEWQPHKPTTIYIADKAGKKPVRSIDVPADFAPHVANAFEQDGNIVIDYVRYPDDKIYKNLGTVLQAAPDCHPPSTLVRMVIGPDDSVSRREIAVLGGDFPQVNPKVAGKPYRYCYAQGFDSTGFGSSRIVKVDIDTGTVRERDLGQDLYVGEPVFVPRQKGQAEDDGWLLSVVYDPNEHRSFLAIVPAGDDFESGDVTKVHLPMHLPVGFHNTFVPQ